MAADPSLRARRKLSNPGALCALLVPALALTSAFNLGCSSGDAGSGATTSAVASTPLSASSVVPSNAPDPARGKTLVEKFECSRCHDHVPGVASAPRNVAEDTKPNNQHCVHCHQAITAGRYKAPKAAATERWRKNVELYSDVPTLVSVGQRFKRSWIEGFLQKPIDLRPRLAPSMPRLALSPEDARDIAAFLAPDVPGQPVTAADGVADPRGRDLLEKKGCVACHAFTGVAPIPSTPKMRNDERGITSAVRLSPDLRFTRDRMTYETVVKWLKSPKAMKADALMPEPGLTDDEIGAIASYLVRTPLEPLNAQAPKPLPPLTRPVPYEEVKAKVFNKVCWHCHADPDYAIGDGGPGNTGGFGFTPRGLHLAAYEGIASGATDDKGERYSVFEALPDGTPRLVAALLARQAEEAGQFGGPLRGMPLGYPALSSEEIQLVATWIQQGHLPE